MEKLYAKEVKTRIASKQGKLDKLSEEFRSIQEKAPVLLREIYCYKQIHQEKIQKEQLKAEIYRLDKIDKQKEVELATPLVVEAMRSTLVLVFQTLTCLTVI